MGRLAKLFGQPQYTAEAKAFFARCPTPLSTQQKKNYNSLFKALKLAGVLAKMDVLYVYAAPTSGVALLNLVSSSFGMTAVNSPTFAANSGYTFNGTTQYLTSSYRPFAGGTKFTQNDSHYMGWAPTLTGGEWRAGNNATRLTMFGANPDYVPRANTAAATITMSLASLPNARMMSWSRDNSASARVYADGANEQTAAVASIGLSDAVLDVGRQRFDASGTSTAYGSIGFRAFSAGQSLTAAEQLALFQALQTYLKAVGAI